MPAPAVGPILSAVSGAGSSGGGGSQNSPNSGGSGMGIKGIVTGVKDKRFFEKQQKAREEAARRAEDQAMFNYDRTKDRFDLAEDIALENYGDLQADYISPEMLTGPGADRYGGALETAMESSQGYNPTMAFNPFLGEYATSSSATTGLRDHAKSASAEGVDRWEDALGFIGDEYAAGRDQLRADTDERGAAVADMYAEDRAERASDEAVLMIDQWASSGRSHEREARAAMVGAPQKEGKSPEENLAWTQAYEEKNLGNKDLFSHGLEGYR